MKKVMVGQYAVFPLSKWTCDVFTGKGWEHRSRFRVFKGHLLLIGGDPVTETEYNELKELLVPAQQAA